MSEAISFNFPKDFNELKDDAEFCVRQGGLLGTVSTAEVASKLTGGSGGVKAGSGSYTTGSGSVAFAEAFDAAPIVLVTSAGGNAHILGTDNVTASGFDVTATDNAGAAATGTFEWIAIG